MKGSGEITMTEALVEPPLIPSSRGVDEEIVRVISRKKPKFRKVGVIQWLLLICGVSCLLASLTVDKLLKLKLLGHHIWKWSALFLVTFNGLLFTEWLTKLVKVYKIQKTLAHALNNTKTTVKKQLKKLGSMNMVVMMIGVLILLTEIATTKVLIFLIASQFFLVAFMFGNISKTMFEAIIFVFVTHPYDVGDHCIIDDAVMVVKEISIWTTVFLNSDNLIVFYPNSVLSAKPIANLYKSPDMGDSLEFCVDFKTPMEKIATLTEKIKECLEKNPKHWHPKHQLVVKEIENNNKLKMALSFTHTMNFQDSEEKAKRRTGLILEMKMVFEELNIGYDLLPQEVLRVINSKGNAAETSS